MSKKTKEGLSSGYAASQNDEYRLPCPILEGETNRIDELRSRFNDDEFIEGIRIERDAIASEVRAKALDEAADAVWEKLLDSNTHDPAIKAHNRSITQAAESILALKNKGS